MIRNLKVLGLALVAIFAMSAMVAQAASANFTAGADEITITGTQDTPNVLKVTNSEIECKIATFHGTAKSATTTLASVTVTPTYTECADKSFGLTTKVDGFGHFGEADKCDYVIRATGANNVDLVCTGSADVTVTSGTCTVHIPPQNGIGKLTFTNGVSKTTGKKDITVDLQITNITGTHTDGFLCPFSGGGHFANGALTGSVTVEADNLATGAPVDVSAHEE